MSKLNLKNDVIPIGYIPSRICLVNPSFYERFDLLRLEAMPCDKIVITSNTSSLPEVVGDAGIMIDLDGLTQAMYDVLTNDDLRENMVKKCLERSKLFSWEKTTKETLNVYENVVNGQ